MSNQLFTNLLTVFYFLFWFCLSKVILIELIDLLRLKEDTLFQLGYIILRILFCSIKINFIAKSKYYSKYKDTKI